MTAFQKVKIKDHCEITSSKRIFANEYLSSGIPFYRGKEISQKQKSSSEVSDLIYISREKFEEIKSKYNVPQKGEILLTSVGTIGNPYLVKDNEEFYFKDGNLTWFRDFNGISGQWLYYWLLSPQGRHELNKCTIGSSQKAYTINLLYGLEIELPDPKIQNKIVSVLSAYDDLIENNEKRIKALEEMAQFYYIEWFVKFKFPGHEKVKMIDSGTEYGKIPQGWEVSLLGNHLSKIESGKRPKGGIVKAERGIPSVGAENVNGIGKHKFESEKYVTTEFFKSMKNGVVKDGDVAIYKDGAYIGRSTYFRNNFPHNEFCVNEHIFLVRTTGQKLTQNSFYLWLQLPETVDYIRSTNTNAAQPGINQTTLKNLKILVPTSELTKKFNTTVEYWFIEIINLAKQNLDLSKTRDLLIPQLVTGKQELK